NGFFMIQLFNADGVGVVASFANIRHSQHHAPSARLDGSRQIAIACQCRTNDYLLRAAAAPSAEPFGSPESEIENGLPFFTRIRQRNPQAFRARRNIELSLEQTFIVCMCERAGHNDGSSRDVPMKLVSKLFVLIRRQIIHTCANCGSPSLPDGIQRSEIVTVKGTPRTLFIGRASIKCIEPDPETMFMGVAHEIA